MTFEEQAELIKLQGRIKFLEKELDKVKCDRAELTSKCHNLERKLKKYTTPIINEPTGKVYKPTVIYI